MPPTIKTWKSSLVEVYFLRATSLKNKLRPD